MAFIVFDLRPLLNRQVSTVALIPQILFVLSAGSGDLFAVRSVEPGEADGTLLIHDLFSQDSSGSNSHWPEPLPNRSFKQN